MRYNNEFLCRNSGVIIAICLTMLICLTAKQADADILDKLENELTTLESEAENLEKTYLKEEMAEKTSTMQVERRVADGELYFRLGDYHRAAMIFIDIVDRFAEHPAYANALFMLAESLFHARDYYGARTRYTEILSHRGESKFANYISPSLSRLLEISMHLGEFEGAEKYFNQISSPATAQTPSSKYVTGKYFYFRGELDRALNIFMSIKEGEDYYPQAQFFTGAIYTLKADYSSAISTFASLTKLKAETPKERRLLNLSRINLGRLYYETNQLERSAEAYESIPPTSQLHDQALYEIAYTYIKMGDHTKAERSLEVLSISNPESKLIPDAKILRANLLLRIGKFDKAYLLFKEIGKQFKPVKDQIDQIVKEHPDPQQYFHQLIKTNLETFDASSFLPPLAITWIKSSPITERGIQLLNELSVCSELLRDNEEIIEKLEFVLKGKGKVNAFPYLKSGKARAIQIKNRLLQIGKIALQYEENLVPASYSSKFNEIRNERKKLEKLVDELPVSPEDFTKREEREKQYYKKLSRILAINEAKVDRLQAKIVATKLYINGTIKQQKGIIPPKIKAVVKELELQTKVLDDYRKEIDRIKKMIHLGITTVGIGDETDLRDMNIRASYESTMRKEIELLKSIGIESGKINKLEVIFKKITQIRQKLNQFDAIVETLAVKKAKEVLATLEKERMLLFTQRSEFEQINSEAEDVMSLITLDNFNKVKKSFDDLIVKSDVGIIDVAWARKEEHKTRVQYLTSERLQQLQILDEEFKEILREEETKKPEEGE